MPLGTTLPYGLRDVRITPYNVNNTLGTPVDLPNSRTFSFSEEEEFTELRGDDVVVATRGQGATCSWDLEAGGISIEAYAAMNGGTIVNSGVTPNQIKTYTKKATDSKPSFKAEGQAYSESGGDFHVILMKCKATDGIEGELADGNFWLTSASGNAIGDSNADVYKFVQNETVTAIP